MIAERGHRLINGRDFSFKDLSPGGGKRRRATSPAITARRDV
jgi:hypothetical protein